MPQKPLMEAVHSAQAQMLYTQKVAGFLPVGGFEPCIAHQITYEALPWLPCRCTISPRFLPYGN